MTFKELLKNRENIEFKIRSYTAKINELKKTYLPGKGNFEGGRTHNNTSPQEVIVLRISIYEEKIEMLEKELIEIEEELEKKLELIDDIRDRWIATLKINGMSWKEISLQVFLSISHIQHIYKNIELQIAEREQGV